MRVSIVDHPLLAATMTTIRDRDTDSPSFTSAVSRAATLLLATATKELPTLAGPVDTPLRTTDGTYLAHDPVLVPVLRAGLGMLAAATDLLPRSPIALVGLRRDERTARASWYLEALPSDLGGAPVLVLEPMIATGGTLGDVVARLSSHRSGPATIVSLICAPEGLAALEAATDDLPIDVHVVAAALDAGLDESHFIVPGLGDAGDRLFGIS